MKKVVTTVIMLTIAFFAMGQLQCKDTQSKFGTDSVKTLMEASMYQEMFKNKNYKDAYPHWKYVIENAPKFQLTPYSDGNKILKEMYKSTKDTKYIDELMQLWDQRAKYWAHYKHYNEAYLLGRKGYDLYNYRKNDIEDVKKAYDYMMQSIEQAGVESEATVIDRAMAATTDLYKNGKIGKDEVVNNFIKFNTLINNIYDVEKNPKVLKRTAKALNNVQQYFILSEAADCNTLQNIFASKYEENKNNKEELLSIVRILNRFECTDSQLYADIAESLYKIAPTSEAALSLGIRYLKAKDMTQAKKYIQEASNMETDQLRKADIHYMLANIALAESRYSTVRTEANKALEIRPDWGKPKLIIAKAYLGSSKGDLITRSKAVWAAVDKAAQAKNDPETASEAQAFINRCSGYFPPCDELFFHSIKKGQSVSVGGWIGGTTTVRCK
ncbi:hypothetical protein C7377_1110 [Balneicella halophila]|uniref:Tetratricopeptide repeat protein n=1 Tax=Balneicella halophila TaxID=1537566 RepID=A0A7L4UP43_BALHA|nr:hypothetical protein [Balneicella halophila]PVX50794.1 hypothetical protein C7377_1110 [Balneicella halophila]